MSTATGLVIDGKCELVPGLTVQNWHDDPSFRLKMGNDGRVRPGKPRVNAVVLHSTRGIPGGSDSRPQRLLPGVGGGGGGPANAHYWSTSSASGGAHLLIDFDCKVICTADLWREEAYHATSVNDCTIGVEIVQGVTSLPSQDGSAPKGYAFFYEQQLAAVVTLVDYITKRLRIQRQIHAPYHGSSHPVPRFSAGGSDCIGVFCHRDQTSNRGPGDPGDFIVQKFVDANYEKFDFAADMDLATWKIRQSALNSLGAALKVDGVAGGATADAMAKFHGHALWVTRPGDAP